MPTISCGLKKHRGHGPLLQKAARLFRDPDVIRVTNRPRVQTLGGALAATTAVKARR